MPDQTRLLVVDDDADIRELLSAYLARYDMTVETAADGAGLFEKLDHAHFDLIILDIMLPGEDGLSLCRRLRGTSAIPVIFLTSLDSSTDRVVGLELGADDYVPKTFSARELLARIRVVLRRMENAGLPEGSDRQDGMLCMHGLCMNPQTLKVTLNNEPLDLTSMEFQLLYHLARGAGRIFSREDLLNLFAEKEWNKFDRCVDVHISSLRKKLGDNSRCPTYLKTVRGLGYMFIKQSDAWP